MLEGIFFLGLVAANYQSLSCATDLVSKFEDSNLLHCEKTELTISNSGIYQFFDKVTCQNQGLLSFHIFERDSGKIILETGGLASGLYPDLESSPSIQEFDNCNEVEAELKKRAELIPFKLSLPERQNFQEIGSILVVTSAKLCKELSDPLEKLITQYLTENRLHSELLCLSNSLLKRKNPSEVRTVIQNFWKGQQGIFIVGHEIPPFEFFYHTGYPGEYAKFGYGSTDLPYGDFLSTFWTNPQSKKAEGIKDIVYKDIDFIYTTHSPTSYTYDLDREEFSLVPPDVWVSRWVGNPEEIFLLFDQWVTRRISFQPYQYQNYLHLRGSHGLMFWPEDLVTEKRVRKEMLRFSKNLSVKSMINIFPSSLLKDAIVKIPYGTTFLNLDEHGNSLAVGDLNASYLDNAKWFPEIINIDACSTGAWYDANPWYESFISHLFKNPVPPLAVIASQGIKAFPTIGSADAITEDVFLSDHISGQSIGRGQLRSFKNNFPFIERGGPSKAFLAQLYHSLSLFGDGSIEY